MLEELDEWLNERGVSLVFAELKDPVREKIERYELTRTIDPAHFFPTVDDAVAEYVRQTGATWHRSRAGAGDPSAPTRRVRLPGGSPRSSPCCTWVALVVFLVVAALSPLGRAAGDASRPSRCSSSRPGTSYRGAGRSESSAPRSPSSRLVAFVVVMVASESIRCCWSSRCCWPPCLVAAAGYALTDRGSDAPLRTRAHRRSTRCC